MRTFKSALRAMACLAALLIAPADAAQTITGTVTGIVKDASGGVLPGVTVTFTQTEMGRKETAVTDSGGRYTSQPLPLGTYRIEATLSGFKASAKGGIALTIDDIARVDFTLEVGALQEVVEVAAQASLVDARTSSVGKLVDNRRIAELPLNTRNVYSLMFLTPGVAGTIGNAYGDLRYTINGARPRSSDTLIDGVTATFPTVTGGQGISVFPSVDAIQEFKVLGATFPAEFGRSLGSVVNVAYKSGSNKLPRQRLRVPARFGARLEELLPEAARRDAGRFLAAPVRRIRRRPAADRQDVLHGVVRRACVRRRSPRPR